MKLLALIPTAFNDNKTTYLATNIQINCFIILNTLKWNVAGIKAYDN